MLYRGLYLGLEDLDELLPSDGEVKHGSDITICMSNATFPNESTTGYI
jgi:hypothetical protein